MKFKKLALAVGVLAFVGLCSFKARNTNNDLLVSKAEQVNQEAFTKILLGNNAWASMSSVKYSTPTLVLVVVFAVAVNTPTFGKLPKKVDEESNIIPGGKGASIRMKALDSN
jgi:hypothetical protein